MLITVLVLIGYAFNFSHEATIISLPLLNKSSKGNYGGNTTNFDEDSLQAGYVKLQPGTKIYFYTTEDENLVIGPKLQSEEEISILFLNQDDDFKKFSQFKNSYIKPDIYSVLKSGVLVPKPKIHPDGFDHEECNKCVYQSLKPTYYIRGFRNILIPVDVLYSKSKQEKLFKNLGSGTLLEPDSWRTDLKVSRWKKSRVEDLDSSKDEPVTFSNSTLDTVWTPEENFKEGFHQQTEKTEIKKVKALPVSEDDFVPDKNCDGEVTLFVLKNDGIFKRIPSDPFLPVGMRLSFTLQKNLALKPKFLKGSNIIMSYTIGKNGDLIPHSENLHQVAAVDGHSVSFMLSQNGGMFPVKEEKENQSIAYYCNGKLVHKSQQFTETFSNSTSILVNNKEFQVFEGIKDEMKYKPYNLSEMLEEKTKKKKKKTKKHHLQKRNVYYGYDRNPGGHHDGMMEDHPDMMRQPPPHMEGHMDYPPPGPRYPSMMPHHPPPPPESPMIPPSEHRPPEMIPPASRKAPSCSSGSCSLRGRSRPQPSETLLPEPEEPSVGQLWENPPLRPRNDIFIFDDKGVRIRLIPEITDNNDVVIYKLTCKGNLVRYPPCKEPEFGFEIHFQLLLDEFVLVPSIQNNKPYLITYILQENGDLIPAEGNINTFRKAPGSLIYYILGKNNVLFPVQQVIDMEGNVSFYYQDFFLLKMKDSTDKPLHFTTKGAPLFAFFNGFTMITISSKPRLNPTRGSNWRHLRPSSPVDGPTKAMYLTGPKGEMIKITPYKNKQGATVVYELDCNGIFYRSPKDKKKCIILRSYILLKDGILLPSNDTSGYVYMMSKNGDLFPYLYPEGKIEAPLASSLKYVLCEKGILLPIKLEIIDNHICYFFEDTIIYKERVYCKSCLERLDEEQFDMWKKPKKGSCDVPSKDSGYPGIKLFINKDGEYVFYEKYNKVLKRFPSEVVPPYLKYTMGSFEVKPDGSLLQIRYQDPSENVINLMLEPNGDLLEDTRNINNIRSQYYVLDSKGNLIAVDAKKTKKNIYFYKDLVRICRVPIPDYVPPKNEVGLPKKEERRIPPLGKDPMKLMDDPYPVQNESGGDTKSLHIPIPLKSLSIAEPGEKCKDCPEGDEKKKCDVLKDTLTQVSKGTSFPLALELELTDEIIEELKNWAERCDKVLNRREIADDIRKYINNLNYVGSNKDHV